MSSKMQIARDIPKGSLFLPTLGSQPWENILKFQLCEAAQGLFRGNGFRVPVSPVGKGKFITDLTEVDLLRIKSPSFDM